MGQRSPSAREITRWKKSRGDDQEGRRVSPAADPSAPDPARAGCTAKATRSMTAKKQLIFKICFFCRGLFITTTLYFCVTRTTSSMEVIPRNTFSIPSRRKVTSPSLRASCLI